MGGAATLHAAKYMSLEVKKDQANLGFLIAADKKSWDASTGTSMVRVHLGYDKQQNNGYITKGRKN